MKVVRESSKQILLTTKIGDGAFSQVSPTGKVSAMYSSILKDYMLYKQRVLSADYACGDVKLRDNSLGFNKNGIIYALSTHFDKHIAELSLYSKEKVIEMLDYFGYLVYYFDDGSYHKRAKTMHVYCNAFTDHEVDCLITKIFMMFGGKVPAKRIDRKRDGRAYPYIYIPVSTTREIVSCYKEFVENRPLLHCMLYKLGLPSQTIESSKCNSLIGE